MQENKATETAIINENSSPVSIGFDAKRAFYNNSGLGNYSRNLLSAFANNYPENSYFLFTPKTKRRIILENEEQYKIVEPYSLVFKMFPSLWRTLFMKNDIRKQKIQIFHGLSHELPMGIEKTGVKSLVTVHDLIFIRYPEFYNPVDIKIYKRKLIHACLVSDHIVAISTQTKSDLIEYLKIPFEKISVIHQGCNPNFRKEFSTEYRREVSTKYNLPERYLLYVGTIEERKNLLGLIKALHIKNIDIPLVVIGKKADLYYKKVLSYITDNKVTGIIFPERIMNNELPVIYQNAECFIYPSFFEGFGLPLVEALVSGVPVITSKNGCFAEAGGPGSIYIDPEKPEEIGEAIQKVLNSREISDKMINKGKEFANNFKDDVIAGNYMKLYHSLLK